MAIRVTLDRRQIAAFLAVFALALAVAAAIKRQPPDFSELAPVALVRDRLLHPLWALRVAAPAHLIAVDAIGAPPPPAGHAYQLWLAGSGGARSLGLLPLVGRRVIPETPASIARLGAGGELIVTLEPVRGSVTGQPSGPVEFRAPLPAVPARRTGCARVACMSGSHQMVAGGSRRACSFRTLRCAGTFAGGWR